MRAGWRQFLVVSCFALLASASFAQESAQPNDELEQVHNSLRELQATMEKAMNAGDIETILANVDDQIVFTTMNGDVARGKDGIREYFEKMMKGPDRVVEKVTSDFVPDDLSILHDGTAIAFGHTNDRYELADASQFDINARWTGTLLNKDGRWVVGAFHYSANVFDNPILNTQRRVLLIGAAIAAILAGGIGLWLGRRMRAAAAA